MLFSAIPGYNSIKQYFIQRIQTRQISHAQLFWGSEGGASLPLALAFITYLYCQNRHEEDACSQCASCLRMKKLVHPNVKFIFPTSATKQIMGKEVVSINFLKQWRSFLSKHPYGNMNDWRNYLGNENKQPSISKEETRGIIRAMSFKAFEGKYQVMLLWLPEHLHITAANALLKAIEEPPLHTLFLLVSACPDNLLGTLRSRTQQIHIPDFTDKTITSMLSQQYKLKPERLAQIVLLADGNFNKACKLVAHRQEGYFDYFKNWIRWCYTHNFPKLVTQAEAFQEMSSVNQSHFLSYSLHMLREALVLYFTEDRLTRVSEEERIFTHKLRQATTYQQIKKWITWLHQAHDGIERHINPRMLHLSLSLKIACTFRPPSH
mmetsp:Transcript_16846/g.38840  ORF Transcript_16846/g.38840 Transcript_16846/m.38840 type:complete len:378 (-) Transcript_16846:5761-6894(-)